MVACGLINVALPVQVLLYDLRSSKPLLVKDHMYGLPIKRVLFTRGSEEEGRVLSMDSQVVVKMTCSISAMIIPDQVVRLWERESGKAYTSIEATAEFNDIVLYPKSGLVFLANEQPKMQVGLPHCKEWMRICLNF